MEAKGRMTVGGGAVARRSSRTPRASCCWRWTARAAHLSQPEDAEAWEEASPAAAVAVGVGARGRRQVATPNRAVAAHLQDDAASSSVAVPPPSP